PTPVETTNHDKEPHLEPISTDEEDSNACVEQSNSPTHTISSSIGHDITSISDDAHDVCLPSSDDPLLF
ncbi:unnamed protein product, partial [Rotaria sp. Silwood1]